MHATPRNATSSIHFFQGDLKKEYLLNSKYSGCLLWILKSFGNFNKNRLNSQHVVSWVIKDYNLGCKLCGLMITRETVITNKISFCKHTCDPTHLYHYLLS